MFKSIISTLIIRIKHVVFCTGGDILNNDGSGSASIYGDMFPDEYLKVNGTKPGFVGMANSGRWAENACVISLLLSSDETIKRYHT